MKRRKQQRSSSTNERSYAGFFLENSSHQQNNNSHTKIIKSSHFLSRKQSKKKRMRISLFFLVCVLVAICVTSGNLIKNEQDQEKAIPTQDDKKNHLSISQLSDISVLADPPTFAPSNSKKPTQKPTAGIYGDNPNIFMTKRAQQIIVGTLTILLFILMAMEFLSPEVLFMIALIIVMLCQILTLSETLSGFANESMITIGTLFLVIGAVEKSHVVDFMARKTFGMGGSHTIAKIRMYFSCFCLSIFFNNTPLVAILLPVVKDWGRVRDIAASQLLIPLSYAVLAGSFVTMIGTSTNLTIQGLMQDDRGYSFGFFEPAPIGIPLFFFLLVYQVAAGPYMLPHHKSGLIRAVRDKAENLIAEVVVSEKSLYIGKSIETMMNALGIAPSRVIKIRRRITPKTEDENRSGSDASEEAATPVSGLKKSGSLSLFDIDYVKRTVPFWAGKPANTANEDINASFHGSSNHGYATTGVVEEDVNATLDELQQGLEHDLESNTRHQHTECVDLIAPSAMEVLSADDVIFISSAQDVVEKLMKSIAGESKGLYILKSNVLALPGYGTEIIECVISDTNPFLGKRIADVSSAFADRYKVGIITARSKDWADGADDAAADGAAKDNDGSDDDSTAAAAAAASLSNNTTSGSGGKQRKRPSASSANGDDRGSSVGLEMVSLDAATDSDLGATDKLSSDAGASSSRNNEKASLLAERIGDKTVSDHVIHCGDVILCAANDKEVDNLKANRDFFVVSTVGNLPKPINLYLSIPVVIFIVMLVLVAIEYIDMCPAALTVTVVFFLGGWITYDEIPKLVDIRLLMLMGTSLSFAKAMTKSGLAVVIAESIYDSDPSTFESLLLIYAITLIITELISNNAAAALMYPIAVALADALGADFKPFAMCVLIASTAGFMSPIGYQTHVMVWGPGGYKFKDFLIFGLVPDIIYWIGGCALIYAMYPM